MYSHPAQKACFGTETIILAGTRRHLGLGLRSAIPTGASSLDTPARCSSRYRPPGWRQRGLLGVGEEPSLRLNNGLFFGKHFNLLSTVANPTRHTARGTAGPLGGARRRWTYPHSGAVGPGHRRVVAHCHAGWRRLRMCGLKLWSPVFFAMPIRKGGRVPFGLFDQ
jgi:hypothetical protein